ncbi:Smr domain-containing protein [Plasmodiophora brassicae]|uniref:Smr domain-containing protein n=1 Tax=Plasmodiophora brassicae TaxID=37360 RepID=A0A0G4IT45_PLABS|nr:hypothetical protein PBRA_006511 [Plasmodiophora brassicae]
MANDRSLAKRLSDARKNEQRLLEQEYALAASAFFHANNARRKMNQIDLHDLSVPEALEYLMERIDTCKAARTKLLTAIVGRGNNSRGRVPVLGRKIKHHLQEKGFVVTNHESNPGCIVVQLCDDAGQTQTAEVPAESQSPPILAPTTQLGVVNPVLQTAPTTTADERRRVAGRQHGRRARQGTKQQLVQNALAADEGNNARRDISDVDLHGVTVNEADTSVMRRIEERKKAGVDHLAVITGSDMRSERGGTFEVGGPPALQRKGPSLPNRIDPDPHRHRRPHQPRCNEGGERRRRRCRRKRGDQGGCPAPLHPRLADQPPRTE